MTRTTLAASVLVFSALIFFLFLGRAHSQQLPPGVPIAPQNYLLPHFWGGGSPLSIDHWSLGSASVADSRANWGANPACLVVATRPALESNGTVTKFTQLPTITLAVLAYEQPIDRKKPNGVFKIGLVTVRGSGALAGTPLSLNTREVDPSLEYGYRVTKTLALGAGLSYLATKSDYLLPSGGVLTRLESRPSGFGGRLGALYSPTSKLSVGGSLDTYGEKVQQSFPAIPFPIQKYQFHSSATRIGVGAFPDSSTKLLLDYESDKVSGAGFRTSRYAYEAGVEKSFGVKKFGVVTLRAGLFAGDLTGGIGLRYRGLEFSYGFSNKYAYMLPGEGAKTSQAIQVIAAL